MSPERIRHVNSSPKGTKSSVSIGRGLRGAFYPLDFVDLVIAMNFPPKQLNLIASQFVGNNQQIDAEWFEHS